MDPIVLVHGYSAESSKTSPEAIRGIYGTFPDDLRRVFGGANVVEIDVSRYVSLEDGLSVDDISRALDRALRMEYAHLLTKPFNVIVHSTGALVIRNWIRTFSPKPAPVRRIVYLAGANFGSGWAHIGKGQLAKWARLVFQAGAERGVQVLDALELGSSWTIDLHHHFLRTGTRMRADYGVFEFVVCGTQAHVDWFEAPVRYAREDGSDGVVRVSASNVNVQYLRFTPTAEAIALAWSDAQSQQTKDVKRTKGRETWYEIAETHRPGVKKLPVVPLAIPYECAHSGKDTGVVIGKSPRAQVLELVKTALAVDSDGAWENARLVYDTLTRATYAKALDKQAPSWWQKWIDEPRAQYDKHAQVVFRVRDQDGRPVEHFDIFFDSETTAATSDLPIRALFEDRHVNDVSPNVINFYLRTDAFDKAKKAWVPRLPLVRGAWIEVSAVEPQTDQIVYLPLRYELSPKELETWIRPHTTTIIDVELLRLPSDLVFKIAGA